MIFLKTNKIYFIILSFLIILLDQLTKYLVNSYYQQIPNKNFFLFTIDYVKNYGAAFDLLSGNRIFLSITSIAISIILLFFIVNKNNAKYIDLLSYSFILGGSLGNGIDRITKGYVLDFININFINFPVFNVADISINIGVLLIFYSYLKYKK